MNLFEETLQVLHEHKKTWHDVVWVGTPEFMIVKDEFESIARDVDYDEGYGIVEINPRLLVVGDGWWLERNEYDGSEWWAFKSMPKQPNFLIRPPIEYIYEPYIDTGHWRLK